VRDVNGPLTLAGEVNVHGGDFREGKGGGVDGGRVLCDVGRVSG